ncbi:MAG TPA: sigma-54 dependent transcriptional regulator [Gemmataceae bacterium]|nr:sigma-54 dependent transcriptional regulator [Gemmataceae bacterium]
MPALLVIDGDPAVFKAFRSTFDQAELQLLTASQGNEGLRLFTQHNPDAVVLDPELPDLPGQKVFHRIREIDSHIPVVFFARDWTSEAAIEAVKQGAHDFLLKPLPPARLREVVAHALQISRMERGRSALPDGDEPEGPDVLIGRCPAIQEVYKAVGRVAPQDVNVLILGESGTGKELVARAIYQHSHRANRPFLAINCAAIPEPLLESELFGHEKGAFTGADRKRIGKFEQCNGGTLFLDEVGDMTPLTQAKILRVLQEQTFERVGGNETVQTDVRVIAATNRDLEEMVARGRFRPDLYYRLSVFAIALPPLRERGEDLPLLVGHFLKRFNRELNKQVSQVAPEALALLERHPWPGNLRELQSVLKQALLCSRGPVLLPEFLPASFSASGGKGLTLPAAGDLGFNALFDTFINDCLQAGSGRLYAQFQSFVDRHLLLHIMRHTRGNQLRAARILGITRNKLRNKLRTLDIPTEHARWKELDQMHPEVGSK